ncbi:AfsA-related hotdog domain-containing protein [Amycolatopsis mongoliensis]|uniref:AfsA-related hotdog domain-containing protein n=1 Tax=Amycolatopsis mongoliensis TaxID=715475 RepID=A0A9Y2JKB2_9PSEU|nr:AfsA-related hotdog domain-containing protein [Amycolatopsis sp. 4-36]WIY00206.1 AfsA-related hotdog domain-containing protein [Amycolatopsis sp. 4-36]
MTPDPTRTQRRSGHPGGDARPGTGEPPAGAGRTHRDVVVIADRFDRFARGDQVLTMTGLLALIDSLGPDTGDGQWVVHAGQGVDGTDRDLIEAATEKGCAPVRLADPDAFRPPVARAGTVHKDRPQNVLLAGVHAPASGHCRADLRIHRDNELILDHHTGEHVQGIVIVEAMRQICIAQFETAVRPGLGPAGYAGVWKRIDLSFQDFLFPLPATVESLIEESDLGREANLKFRATTAVRQHGRTVATAVIEYAMIAQGRIDALERRKADQATRAYLG